MKLRSNFLLTILVGKFEIFILLPVLPRRGFGLEHMFQILGQMPTSPICNFETGSVKKTKHFLINAIQQ